MKQCDEEELTRSIHALTHALHDILAEQRIQFSWMVSHHHFATKQDIDRLHADISMKLNDIKTTVATVARQNREAFQELGAKIADLNQQIADLVAAQNNPDVTDEAFLADLTALQADAQALADIVPNAPTTPPTERPTDPTARRNA